METCPEVPRESRHLKFSSQLIVPEFAASRRMSASERRGSKLAGRQSNARGSNLPTYQLMMTVLDVGGRQMKLPHLPEAIPFDWDASLEITDQVLDFHRRDLRSGLRVLELGCGLGLPSMVCAALGSQVLSTDLQNNLLPLRQNAKKNGYPQDVWEVVGGHKTNGINVQTEMGIGDLKERLEPGALIEQLEKEGNYLQYTLLRGKGPKTGWLKIKRYGCDPDVELSPERPPMDQTGGVIKTAEFKWDPDNVEELTEEGEFDIIICSDCVYEPTYGLSWKELAECFKALCAPHTVIYFAVINRKYDGVPEFLEHVRHLGLLINELHPNPCVEKGKLTLWALRRETKAEKFTSSLTKLALSVDAESAASDYERDAKPKATPKKTLTKKKRMTGRDVNV